MWGKFGGWNLRVFFCFYDSLSGVGVSPWEFSVARLSVKRYEMMMMMMMIFSAFPTEGRSIRSPGFTAASQDFNMSNNPSKLQARFNIS